MSTEIKKTLSKDALILLNLLNKGTVDIPRVKALLAAVGALGSPAKRKVRVNKYEALS